MTLVIQKPTGGKLICAKIPQPLDADAQAYVNLVERADGQRIEDPVRFAINNFVIGCKADGIWNAIKASCILAGARTLSGALVPLVGAAPTSFNFVAGDYNRKTGLVGNGSTKYLDSNYAYPNTLQNNCHISAHYTLAGSAGQDIAARASNTSLTPIAFLALVSSRLYQDSLSTFFPSDTTTLGFRGINRTSATTYIYRRASANETATANSVSATLPNFGIFARISDSGIDAYSNRRLAFYSIGESLDLALLDARVTTLINALGAAIP